jgi:ABC-2 type transport system ATP-binding protein
VIVLHRGRVVADDSVAHLRQLMSHTSLEEVFSELAINVDPAAVARDILDLATLRA